MSEGDGNQETSSSVALSDSALLSLNLYLALSQHISIAAVPSTRHADIHP